MAARNYPFPGAGTLDEDSAAEITHLPKLQNSTGRGLSMTRLRAAVIGVAFGLLCDIGQAQEQPLRTVTLNIDAATMAKALIQLTQQSGLQLIFPTDGGVARLPAPKLVGSFTPEEALKKLLAGSSLRYEFINAHTVAIRTTEGSRAEQLPGSSSKEGDAGEDPPATVEGASPNNKQAAQQEPVRLQEVVVTAQKKTERLLDVPLSVSVISAAALTDSNQTQLKDYYSSVPGLTYQASILGQQLLSIRGIGNGAGAPTVAITIDDVPVSASSDYTGGSNPPDIDPGDLDHIEVLRGPQGTLYGANSMGGLIKFVTKDPSISGYSGRVEAGVDTVRNGAGAGYLVRASGNIPLSGNIAMRISGFDRQDPGYINDPALHLNGVNKTGAYGGRASLLLNPSDHLSIKLSALYQHNKTDSSPEEIAAPGLTSRQTNLLPGLQGDGIDTTVQAYSAVIKAKLGNIDVASLTGYNVTDAKTGFDATAYFAGPAQQYGVGGSGIIYNNEDRTFTQEVRFSGSLGVVDWRVGGFYKQDRLNPTLDDIYATDLTTGAAVADLEHDDSQTRISKQYAGYGDLAYHVTDRLQVQFGGRESHDSLAVPPTISTGPLVGATPFVSFGSQSGANTFTYLASPQFNISADLMVYARFASGYRPGGPNLNKQARAAGLPATYGPDKTNSYEAGIKGEVLDRRLAFDASLYRVNWSDIQVFVVVPPSFGLTENAGDAKSQGFELSLEGRPVSGLTVAGWVDYDDAVLTQNFPSTSTIAGHSGDRLPDTAKISAHVSLEDEFALAGAWRGFVGAAVGYRGERVGLFTGNGIRQDYPSYTKTDLHLGAKYDTWMATIYVNNVGDVRGLINGGVGTSRPNGYYYITPRMIGLNVAKTF